MSIGAAGVAVVGLGFGRQVHIPAFQRDTRSRIVAVVSRNTEASSAAARELNVPRAYSDWQDALNDDEVRVVTIAVPQPDQSEIATAALRAGKAVFCEKPLATTAAEAGNLASLARKAGQPNLVNFEFPEQETWQAARRQLAGGAIGALAYLDVAWHVLTYGNRIQRDDWRACPELGGGALNAFGTHIFHYLEWFGGPLTRLSARLGKQPGDARPGETLVNLWVEFASGATGAVSLNTTAGPGHIHRLRFYGQDGALELVNDQPDYLAGFKLLSASRVSGAWREIAGPSAGDANVDGRIQPTSRLAGRLLDWLATGTSATPNFADGCRAQVLVEAARSADAGGCWVDVTRSAKPIEVFQVLSKRGDP